MLRIVGGTLRGRLLRTPEGRGTRPTAARVREALFDVITHHPDLGVDLDGPSINKKKTGSGALGIEALSRGAAWALFVEQDRRVVALLRRNLEELALTDRSEVWPRAVARAAADLSGLPPFDLVLCDPPYGAREETARALSALRPAARLGVGGLLVLEQAAGGEPPDLPGLTAPQVRRWGDTEALFYTRPSGGGATEGHERTAP